MATLYKEYMAVLSTMREEVGSKQLWRTKVHGCVVGEQDIHEVAAIWYPTHQAFLDLNDCAFIEEEHGA